MGINLLWLLCGIFMGGFGGALWRRRAAPGGAEAAPALREAKMLGSSDVTPPSASVSSSSSAVAMPLPLHYYQALELAQFKGGFLARTAHELRSPLSSLMGLHQLILTDLCDSPEEERECVAQAYEAAQNFHGLLETLITVSKLELGSKTLKIQPVDLDLLLADVTMAVQLPLADRNIRFTVNLKPDGLELDESEELPPIKADYACLRQVLIELIVMAGDFKASEISCEVIVPADGDQLGLMIHDNRAPQAWQETLADWDQIQAQSAEQLDCGAQDADGTTGDRAALEMSLKENWQPSKLSPGLSLRVQRSLLEVMGGRLERAIVAPDTSGDSSEAQEKQSSGTAETDSKTSTWDEIEAVQPQLCCWFNRA